MGKRPSHAVSFCMEHHIKWTGGPQRERGNGQQCRGEGIEQKMMSKTEEKGSWIQKAHMQINMYNIFSLGGNVQCKKLSLPLEGFAPILCSGNPSANWNI